MGQYRPCYRAGDYPGFDRPITRPEFSETLPIARRYALIASTLIRFDMSAHSLDWRLPRPLDLSALVVELLVCPLGAIVSRARRADVENATAIVRP